MTKLAIKSKIANQKSEVPFDFNPKIDYTPFNSCAHFGHSPTVDERPLQGSIVYRFIFNGRVYEINRSPKFGDPVFLRTGELTYCVKGLPRVSYKEGGAPPIICDIIC